MREAGRACATQLHGKSVHHVVELRVGAAASEEIDYLLAEGLVILHIFLLYHSTQWATPARECHPERREGPRFSAGTPNLERARGNTQVPRFARDDRTFGSECLH